MFIYVYTLAGRRGVGRSALTRTLGTVEQKEKGAKREEGRDVTTTTSLCVRRNSSTRADAARQ